MHIKLIHLKLYYDQFLHSCSIEIIEKIEEQKFLSPLKFSDDLRNPLFLTSLSHVTNDYD